MIRGGGRGEGGKSTERTTPLLAANAPSAKIAVFVRISKKKKKERSARYLLKRKKEGR